MPTHGTNNVLAILGLVIPFLLNGFQFFFSKNSNVVGSGRELVVSSLLFLLELTLKLANTIISPEMNKRVIASLDYTKTPWNPVHN